MPAATGDAGAYPPISIVTPSYNQGHYIEQTIRSVLLQGYPRLEYIVIDGGSGDDTQAILRKYEPWLTAWVSEPDGGQTDAINKGFARCTGEVFNWLNSDDYYEPGALLRVGQLFAENPGVEVVCGRENIFRDDAPDDVRLSSGSAVLGTVEETLFRAHIDQPPTFFRRGAMVPLMPLTTALKYLMDVELWVKYLLVAGQDNILKTGEVLVNFRLHTQSKTVSQASLFAAEREAILRSLGRCAGVPPYILDLLTGGPPLALCPGGSRKVNFGRLAARYARRYAGNFYNRGQYGLCRQCAYVCLKNDLSQFRDPGFFRLALIAFVPGPLLDAIRKPRKDPQDA
jgi:glycosyltransferase involved in cell wall biosynthesis